MLRTSAGIGTPPSFQRGIATLPDWSKTQGPQGVGGRWKGQMLPTPEARPHLSLGEASSEEERGGSERWLCALSHPYGKGPRAVPGKGGGEGGNAGREGEGTGGKERVREG